MNFSRRQKNRELFSIRTFRGEEEVRRNLEGKKHQENHGKIGHLRQNVLEYMRGTALIGHEREERIRPEAVLLGHAVYECPSDGLSHDWHQEPTSVVGIPVHVYHSHAYRDCSSCFLVSPLPWARQRALASA